MGMPHNSSSIFLAPLKSAQMLGDRKSVTGAYMEIREDYGFLGNTADGWFLEVPS
jgi:hypothetical protein